MNIDEIVAADILASTRVTASHKLYYIYLV